MVQIEHDSPIPLYVQIKEHLRTRINAGDLAGDTRLPSERQLAKEFNVSRLTVTKALKELEQEGLIYTQVGKGTYVTPKFEQNLETLTSFTQEMTAHLRRPSSRVLQASVEPAIGEVALALKVAPGTEVFVLHRVRLADGQPMGLEHSHVLHSLCMGIADKHDFAHESLYRVLEQEYGIHLTIAYQTVEARLATHDEARLLDITTNTPVLSMSRVTATEDNLPAEYVLSIYPGDRYKFHTVLRTARLS